MGIEWQLTPTVANGVLPLSASNVNYLLIVQFQILSRFANANTISAQMQSCPN